MGHSSPHNLFAGVFIIFAILITLYLSYNAYYARTGSTLIGERCGVPMPGSQPSLLSTTPVKRRRIAIASEFGHHFDVYMSVAWSLARAMNYSSVTGSIEVFAEVPFNYQFMTVVNELGLYGGDYQKPEGLLHALRSQMGDGGIDMVILGTCEVDLRNTWKEDLISIWDERDDDHKFQLVCIVHNIQDVGWQPSITEWSRRDAIRLVTISEHVAYSFRESFRVLADSVNTSMRLADYEHIQVDVHVPILPLRNLPARPSQHTLSKAVIQGSFSVDRRDYIKIFKDLNTSLHEDPEAWGYLPLGNEESFIPNTSLADPPFQLFLLGSGWLDVPGVLKNIVFIKTGLTYPEFYDLMGQMDICVPAFAENGYYHMQASSTFVMAVQCNVPLLVTKRTRKSYLYADDDRVTVTRPAVMREITALKALRLEDASSFLNADMPNMQKKIGSNSAIRDATEEMLQRGWRRRKSDSDSFKNSLWARNDALSARLLRDL